MGEVSGRLADFSIITADNSRYEDVNDIINDILIGMHKTNGKYVTIPDRKEAIKYSIEKKKVGHEKELLSIFSLFTPIYSFI